MSPSPQFTAKRITPTPQQLAVQTASAQTLLIEANAGAAKTTTLALRMAEGWARGIRPEDFLALTHTASACQALRAALLKVGVPAPVAQRFRITRFEDFCAQLLQETLDRPATPYQTLEELQPFVWEAVQRVQDSEGERWPEDLALPSLGDSGFVEAFLQRAAWLKGTMKDTLERGDASPSPDYAGALGIDYTQLKVFLAFERIRRRELTDQPQFQGVGDATYDLALWLEQGGAVQQLRLWPRALRVLLVDEMHDVNQAAFRVLQELLTTTKTFFCGVGDRDQVIYSASGADSAFMGEAIAQRTGRSVQRLPLTPSHRFGAKLAVKAGRLAHKDYSSLAAHDTRVTLLAYDTADECADLVVAQALAWSAQPRANMADFAVLLRHPHQSVELENRLLAAGLPYTTSGFDSYLLRPEVLLVRALLAVATDNFDSITEPRTRQKLMQALVFFCGARIVVAGREEESQAALLADAIRSVNENPLFLQHFFDHQILENSPPAMQKRLAKALRVAGEPAAPGALERLLQALDIEATTRDVLVSRQRRHDVQGSLAGLCRAAARFASAHDYFLHLNFAEQQQRQLKSTASLVLASIAQVKGLEFAQVVIPYLERGVFPAPSTGAEAEAGSDANAEHNLLYVGMTRARTQLTLLAHRQRPSSLLAALGYTPKKPAGNESLSKTIAASARI